MGRRTAKNWQSFSGQSRQLIIAIDVGTTFSGAAYSILQPGEVPKIYDVGSFPGQQAGFHKVPSTIFYSPNGSILGIGSETSTDRIKAAASHIGAYEARWWKMALKSTSSRGNEAEDMDDFIFIPPGKSAQDIFADYLSWIMKCTEDFIAAKYRGGAQLIQETYRSRTIVLTHPNGWEGAQQTAMRKACVDAGIIDLNKVKNIQFVSEAEASLNFALTSQAMSSWTEDGSQIIIVDAGGGTIDITSYEIISTSPFVSVKETSVPRCLMAGATYVDRRAAELIGARLEGTRWDNPDDLNLIIEEFNRIVKHSFSKQRNPCVVKIGPSIDNDERIGIRRGMLVLDWDEVAALFQPSIDETVVALGDIFSHLGHGSERRVALVGGFSENAFFRESVISALSSEAIVAKPDNATSKAVANGAVAWAIDSVVCSRVSKVWYGICCAVAYNRHNEQHSGREKDIIYSADGKARLPNGFQCMLAKGEAQSPEKEAVAEFSITKSVGQRLEGSFDLIAYRGDDAPPCFIEDDNGFESICRLEVNLDRLQSGLPVQTIGGRRYKRVRFQIHALLSDTELKARWVWNDQAVEQCGEVHTVFLDELKQFTRKAAPSYDIPVRPFNANFIDSDSLSLASLDLQSSSERFSAAHDIERSSSASSFGRPYDQHRVQQPIRTQRDDRSASRQPLAPHDLLMQSRQSRQVVRESFEEERSIDRTHDGPREVFETGHTHSSYDVKNSGNLQTRTPLDSKAPIHLNTNQSANNEDPSPPPAYTFFDADIER